MKPIHLSRHARNRVRLYRLLLNEIEDVVRSPSEVKDSVKGRRNAYGSPGGRPLRVTYIEEADEIVVVTVTPDVNAPGD